MSIAEGFAGAVGNTPLIRLSRLSAETGCDILGKAEFMNPGGSVKDRAARAIITAAQRDGSLRPGGTVVEGTAGNTGISLAHLCHALGYRCVIVMPDNQSPEKFEILRTLGVELETVNGDIEFVSELRDGGELGMESVNGSIEANFTKEVAGRFDIETFNGSIRNCFGPEPKRTSKYSPGLELSFEQGDGDSHVIIETLNGSIRICNR